MLQKHHELLRCPDDSASLRYTDSFLQCMKCRRIFPIHSDNLVELLPIKPYPLEANDAIKMLYWSTYNQLLKERFELRSSARGWGYLPSLPVGLRSFVKKDVKIIKEYLRENLHGFVCDVSGGAGNYSLEYTKTAKLVAHCDLDVDSINCAYERSRQSGLRRILFVRCDYLQLPFASNSFDAMICIDSLERGMRHEIRLLTEIIRCLKPEGKAIVDFHNKLRAPALLLSETRIKTYSRQEILKILRTLSVENYEIKPLGYVPQGIVPFEGLYPFLDKIFQLVLIPPSRYAVLVRNNRFHK